MSMSMSMSISMSISMRGISAFPDASIFMPDIFTWSLLESCALCSSESDVPG